MNIHKVKCESWPIMGLCMYLSQCTMNNIDRVARFVSCSKVRVNSDGNIYIIMCETDGGMDL